MKRHAWTLMIGVAMTASLLTGCRSTPDSAAMYRGMYQEALLATRDSAGPDAGSPEEAAMFERFEAFYEVYSIEAIRAGVREVYADDAYFGDPFKAVVGIEAIEAYFVKMAEPVHACTFTITQVARAGEEVYAHWIMNLALKRSPDDPIIAMGMSHVRFNRKGKVVFQQDYWDSSALLERLPVIGGMTRYVKRRLEAE